MKFAPEYVELVGVDPWDIPEVFAEWVQLGCITIASTVIDRKHDGELEARVAASAMLEHFSLEWFFDYDDSCVNSWKKFLEKMA